MEMLVEKNDLQDFSPEWRRVLAGIHYEMDRQAFSNVNNFVMAENVSTLAVATIKEHSLQLPGVEIVKPAPAATTRAISSRRCWAVWARSRRKSGR